MATDLQRGSFSGATTKLYFNTGTHDSPTWVEVTRARNVQMERGPNLSETDAHGFAETGNVTGYFGASGSCEYLRRIGTDTVYAALVAAREGGEIIELAHLNGPIDEDGPVGWTMPCYLGKFSETSSGNDAVSVTIPFAKAECYDALGEPVNYAPIAGSST